MENLRKQPATMKHLPDELLTDILTRLPAKQLAQYRCVSKSMNAILYQPSFIKSHLHRSTHNNLHETLLVFYGSFCFKDGKPITAHPCQSPHIKNPIRLPTTLNIPHGYTHTRVIGSINGLICFTIWSHNGPKPTGRDPIIYIWNPSINAIKSLPPYTVPVSIPYEGINLHIRFVYDPKTDDYNVVKFSRLDQRTMTGFLIAFEDWLQVEVYSMRKGFWRLINDRFPSRVDWIHSDEGGRSIVGKEGYDGRVHWLCFVGGQGAKHAIIAFDLGMETFSEISLPNSVAATYSADQKSKVLGNLAGKLCVMSYNMNGDIEVWVMDEYGVAESWVRHHVVSEFRGNIVPIGFTLNNEFILRGPNNRLALYDQVAAKVKSINVSSYSVLVGYVDSLVWIEPAN